MSLPSHVYDPLRIASVLSPAIFSLGDPDLLVELLNSNPAGVVLVEADPDLPIVYCNETFHRWAPLRDQPILGRPLPELFVWADRNTVRSTYRQVIQSRMPVHRRSVPYHLRADDEDAVGYWSASHYPLRGPRGWVTHVLTVSVDVTDQAVGEARLQDTQHRALTALARIAKHLTAAGQAPSFLDELSATIGELVAAKRVSFWLYDADTETISAQPARLGFNDDELQLASGLPCRAGGTGALERVVFDDLTVMRGAEVVVPWKAGEHRLGAVGAYESIRPSGFTNEDVRALQAAATAAALVWENRQADDAVADLREREATNLRQRIEQSIQLEQLKTDFLKLASHELRGPLAVVRGYVSMMEDGTLGQVGKGVAPVLPLLRAKLDEMNQLINEIVETARLEDSALELQVQRLDLRDVVQASVHALEPLTGEGLELVARIASRPVPVVGDGSRLRMIVTNLVHNAIKYSPQGGEIRVTCTAEDGMARVAVRDQGVGISPQDRDRLFTRFGRIVTRETAGLPGTGLGLYLARDLARRHGGDVTLESELGRGSTFTLSLPLSSS